MSAIKLQGNQLSMAQLIRIVSFEMRKIQLLTDPSPVNAHAGCGQVSKSDINSNIPREDDFQD
jgi:hypothetical protein